VNLNMDTRYQIEEMVSQDTKGVVFQGMDTVTGMIVAMRRFISAGCGGSQVGDDERKAFSDAVFILKKVTHPSLRRVFAGGCDPVDEMPYLVTRWTESSPLADLLANKNLLESGFARLILHQLLDTTATLSEALGKEGQWLEASLESIRIRPPRDKGELPTALFWLDPLAWLHPEDSANDVMGLADLAEAMLGGPREVATNPADDELASWIQRVREKEITTLDQAKKSLKPADSVLNPFATHPHQPEPSADGEAGETKGSVTAGFDVPGLSTSPAPRHSFSSRALLPSDPTDGRKGLRPLVIAAITALIGVAIFVSWIAMGLGETESTETFSNEHRPPDGQDGSRPTAMQVQRDIGDNSATEELRQFIQRRGYYTINEADLMFSSDLEEVTFRGKLSRVRMSSSGLTMYLEFSDEAPIEEPRAYAMTRNLVDGIRQADLEAYVGRQIEVRGPIDIEDLNGIRRARVKIIGPDRLRVLKPDEDYELR